MDADELMKLECTVAAMLTVAALGTTEGHGVPYTIRKYAEVLEGLRETIWRDRPPIFVEIQKEHYDGSASSKAPKVKDLLYPDHIIFEVGESVPLVSCMLLEGLAAAAHKGLLFSISSLAASRCS